jgi:hypothetical protein
VSIIEAGPETDERVSQALGRKCVYREPAPYSSDDEAAMQALGAMVAAGLYVVADHYSGGVGICTQVPGVAPITCAGASTFPLAVSRLALHPEVADHMRRHRESGEVAR